MIYVTGDTHGKTERFEDNHMNDAGWTKEDYLLVCGDFGYLFRDDADEQAFLDKLERTKPYTICFCDGNHENFTALYDETRHPQEEWHGGKVHRIRKNVVHLMRGQIFEIEGKSVFTMGGAYSIDRARREFLELDGYGKQHWKEELPTSEEYREAIQNLKRYDHKVDIVITHTAPLTVVYEMKMYPDPNDMELTGFLDWMYHDVAFGHWYYGHWHLDENIFDNVTAVYKDVRIV